VGSDPEELATTLRELARLDPVELGLQAVLERIVQAAATGCGSTGGVGLLLLGSDAKLRYAVAAGRPRRLLAGTQVRLAEGPSVDAFLQAAPVSSSDLAAEPRWPDFRPLATLPEPCARGSPMPVTMPSSGMEPCDAGGCAKVDAVPRVFREKSANLSCAMVAIWDCALGRSGTPATPRNKTVPNR
jgi:hypothetical protein